MLLGFFVFGACVVGYIRLQVRLLFLLRMPVRHP